MLLRNFPDADVVDIWNQSSKVVDARKQTPRFDDVTQFLAVRASGPWTCADLFIEDEIERFAIWNETGYVYRLDDAGAVEDDPFLKIRD